MPRRCGGLRKSNGRVCRTSIQYDSVGCDAPVTSAAYNSADGHRSDCVVLMVRRWAAAIAVALVSRLWPLAAVPRRARVARALGRPRASSSPTRAVCAQPHGVSDFPGPHDADGRWCRILDQRQPRKRPQRQQSSVQGGQPELQVAAARRGEPSGAVSQACGRGAFGLAACGRMASRASPSRTAMARLTAPSSTVAPPRSKTPARPASRFSQQDRCPLWPGQLTTTRNGRSLFAFVARMSKFGCYRVDGMSAGTITSGMALAETQPGCVDPEKKGMGLDGGP